MKHHANRNPSMAEKISREIDFGIMQKQYNISTTEPWTVAILELLAEIHATPNLKASLKFEIEVLFKNLDVDMKAVTPTSLLKDRGGMIDENPDLSQQLIVEEDYPVVKAAINPVELRPEAAAGPSYQGGPSRILYQLPAPTSNTPAFHLLYLNTHFQRILPMAMDKAIEGIVSTIVKRTVFIATQTTMELVLKEYITEPDENFTHSTSCMLIVCLAGNLSYINCKETLCSSMSTELRNTVQACTELRNTVQGLYLASEFLELAVQCVIIESGNERSLK